MPNIAIILASARPGCAGAAVAHWVLTQAEKRTDATFDLIDLAEVDLPQIDEAMPPALGRYTDPHTQQWADIIADFDGYVIVTPEYNHSFPGVLKNALDRVYAEWNNKAVGLVSYGVDGGVRAVEALRLVLSALQLADVSAQVTLNMRTDFGASFIPGEHQGSALTTMLDQLVTWSTALVGVRAGSAASSA
ncbi:NAD(P)H-dependent oxidoreductase [Streptomyces sp. NBC_00825]|uniref:NADPH-dependent FMN reductase n=1 Tax=unclassified Streptomyces TaxID=2593676 RepID=UPI00224F90D6|nr:MULTISPECIES: NAD(P)H-dependent oxidoreductase [unclassified Streptomyces]WTB59466.1 NAD(P)H-dependent oxidoreductase [Streptomyces sp. NBC_00826]WTH87665.1 NAD(P)H-dependent oxidoreductase [Streptomyces sp. NBC_00825]WTH96391.1 NAD(P)H-dependent oxidoreductase [Streptomyces sp. NBC_00822]MCX4869848.1 NAD(P)H-dependent oxidoreductase [Streptomyces sp. NBC_00906]MCX4901011.1 NAD(P)H-dependent oxidoreductase [Streptomyces sp. NBC_00892]